MTKIVIGLGLLVVGIVSSVLMARKKKTEKDKTSLIFPGVPKQPSVSQPPVVATPVAHPKASTGAEQPQWADGFSLEQEQGSDPWVVVIKGSDEGKTYRLGQRPMSIGRSASNFIQMTDPQVSRRHCRLTPIPGGFEIIDMTNSGGTVIGGKAVTIQPLRDRDIITIGGAELRYEAKASYPMDHTLGRRQIGAAQEAATQVVGNVLAAAASASDGGLDEVLELGRRAKAATDKGEVIREIGKMLLEKLDLDRVLVIWQRDEQWSLLHRYTRGGLPLGAIEVKPDKSLMASVGNTGAPVHMSFPGETTTGAAVFEAAAVPLAAQGNVVGIIYFDRLMPRDNALSDKQIQYAALISDNFTILIG